MMNYKTKGSIEELLPDSDNFDQAVEGKTVEIFISNLEISRLLSSYDQSNELSPSDSDCRPLVRAILDYFSS